MVRYSESYLRFSTHNCPIAIDFAGYRELSWESIMLVTLCDTDFVPVSSNHSDMGRPNTECVEFSGWGTQWRDGVYSMIKLKQACDAASNPRRPRNLFLQTNTRWSCSVSSHDPFTACFVWWQNPAANFDWRVVSMYLRVQRSQAWKTQSSDRVSFRWAKDTASALFPRVVVRAQTQ